MRCIYLFLVFAVLHTAHSEGNIVACGAQLDMTLKDICKGKTNRIVKLKFGPSKHFIFHPNSIFRNEIYNDMNNYIITRSRHRYHHRRLVTRGIIEECCKNSCTREQLEEYCAED